MSKKALNIDAITNELEGASLFFTKQINSPTLVSNNTPQTPPPTAIENVDLIVPQTVETRSIQPIEKSELIKENANERADERSNERSNEVSKEEKKERTNNQTSGQTDEQKIERPKKRSVVRHSFDIYADQLLSLREITLSRERLTGDKVLLGDLAKEAMDLLIKKEKTK